MFKPIHLDFLEFTGPDAEKAKLPFAPGLNVLYGASNTGKSFAVKSLDFMLGSSRELPDISERRAYESACLNLLLPTSGFVSLVRALAGGAFDVPASPTLSVGAGHNGRQLSARHDPSNNDNLSQFLLTELSLASKSVAMDANGKKRSLSFRDLARYCIVDETSIQSETSPAESGQYQLTTAERSVFKLLVTGIDDAAIVPVVDRKTFKAATAGKLEMLDEMIVSLEEQLTSDYPNADELPDQNQRLEQTYVNLQFEFQQAQESIRDRLRRKRDIADRLGEMHQRRGEIEINTERFSQLQLIYQSDIQRLEAIEEAGFLLTLEGEKECPLCGAPSSAQKHTHSAHEIEKARQAAEAEIKKIAKQAEDLKKTLQDLQDEGSAVVVSLDHLDEQLKSLERELGELAPTYEVAKQRLDETLIARDRVRQGLALLEQRQSLTVRRDELAALRPARKAEKPKLGITAATVHDFAQTVSVVLKDWHFPGQRHVTFDETSYDLRIDGKHRRDNGKGVRAITHAAFKVALLLYCRERNLPHPGFLVLDTPLLTYRDPLRSRAGALSADEQEVSQTSLKDHFFEHLAEHSKNSQFWIIENVDLPANIHQIAHVETFTGEAGVGRRGLFHHRSAGVN
jgi:hypothetical protein